MTKVNIYYPTYNDHHSYILSKLHKGIPSSTMVDVRRWEPSDISVIFGGVKKSFSKSWTKQDIIDKTIAAGGRVLFVEEGFVKRGQYYSVGWDGINGHAKFCNEFCPSDRWDNLGINIRSKKRSEDKYLICGQVPWDVSVQDTDHGLWCRTMFHQMRDLGHDVMFRPHPRMVNDSRAKYGIEKIYWDSGPLEECLRKYSHVLTFNSNVGVDAVIAGCQTMAADKGSMVYDVFKKGRRQWAWDIAWAQWNLEEMASGMTWSHLSNGVGLTNNLTEC